MLNSLFYSEMYTSKNHQKHTKPLTAEVLLSLNRLGIQTPKHMLSGLAKLQLNVVQSMACASDASDSNATVIWMEQSEEF